MEIDHIGVVVDDIDEALQRYINHYGFKCLKKVIFDSSRRVRLALLTSENNFRVELIQPTDEKSPSYDFMKRGGGIQHFCYRVKNIENTIEYLKKEDHFLISRPAEAKLMNGRRVAFMFSKKDKQVVELIEILER
ncbi:MAG: VOC family protein [Promethearchaeota archaeon]